MPRSSSSTKASRVPSHAIFGKSVAATAVDEASTLSLSTMSSSDGSSTELIRAALRGKTPKLCGKTMTIPAEYCCLISGRVMEEPVPTATGVTFDKKALKGYVNKSPKPLLCPVTRKPLVQDDEALLVMIPENSLKVRISIWRHQHNIPSSKILVARSSPRSAATAA